jgi:hypothetical protein
MFPKSTEAEMRTPETGFGALTDAHLDLVHGGKAKAEKAAEKGFGAADGIAGGGRGIASQTV